MPLGEEKSARSLDDKVEMAAKLVRQGQEPMKGIMMLREVLEEDSTNIKAHFQLGLFSVQSNQLEKAIGRFNRILELDSTYFDARFYLGHVYANMGEKEMGIEQFEKYKAMVKDEKLRTEADRYINELQKL